MQPDGHGKDSRRDALGRALASANIPTLVPMLVQMTGDRRWLKPPYLLAQARGTDDNDDGGLDEERQAEIRQAAFAAITADWAGAPVALPRLSADDAAALLSAAMGETVPAEFGARIAANVDVADSAPPASIPPGTLPPDYLVVVIGAGPSGLCAAAKLKERGIPLVVLDKADDIGGTWHESRYPGAAVDTPNHIYSLSFVPYDWKRYFAAADEVRDYLHHVVEVCDLHDSLRLGTEVVRAEYLPAERRWRVDTLVGGEPRTLLADAVVSAVGAFNPPVVPAVPGIERFDGPVFHTARWPAEFDPAGKRIALVGNGASAMQVGPAIADDVASLTVFQRSAHWIAPFPKFRMPVPEETRFLLREVPLYRAWNRERIGWLYGDRLHPALQHDPDWPHQDRSINKVNDGHRRFFTRYLLSELGDRGDLIKKVLPDFAPFGKRLLLDNGWYRTLLRDHVALVTDPITGADADGLRTGDVTHPVDAVVFATGYDVSRFVSSYEVRGETGRTLQDTWDGDDARAYLGLTVPGFPNFFMIYGPNSAPGGGGSLLYNVEAQVHYLVDLLVKMAQDGIATVDCRPDVFEAYNKDVEQLHDTMVYLQARTRSYYRNSKGRVVVNTPLRNVDFWRITRTADLSEYHCERRVSA